MILLILPVCVKAITDISVSTAYTNPYPVEPGSNIVLGLEIKNNGGDAAKNLEITLVPQNPFSLLEEAKKEISSLDSGSVRVIEYDLFVDSSAVSTVYQLPLKIKFSGSNEVTRNVNIRVQGKPNLGYVEVPNFSILPGEIKTMRVEIKNLGTGTAKRAIATLSSSDNIKTVSSGGNVFIGDIPPSGVSVAMFELYASSDAEFGVYDSILRIDYEDESGNKMNKSFNLGLLITGKPDIRIIKVDVDQSKNELEVEIINQGSSEAKGIKGELMLGSTILDVDYLSKLNPDKSATLKFKIPNIKNMTADIRLSYNGPDNKKYESRDTIKWSVKSNGIPWLTIIIAVVVLYIGVRNNIHKKVFGLFKRKAK